MNREKAIYELEDAKDGYAEYLSIDAINMAIEALKQPEPCKDTISRQAAIDALQKCRKHCIDPFDSYHIDINDAECRLSEVPPAQPVATDINVGDKISRQAAIDVLADYIYNVFKALSKIRLSTEDCKDAAKSVLDELPPAQSEPKEGHWIDKGWDGDWAWQIEGRGNCWRVIECSECGKSVSVESNFCPHCGADMRGEKDD